MHRWITSFGMLLLAACSSDNVQTPPELRDRTVTTAEDTAVTFLVDVTAADESLVALTIVTPPRHGAITGAGPLWTYTPAPDYHGSDTVVVRAKDLHGSATGTVAITVTPINDPPIANADGFASAFNVVLNIPQSAILANDTDIDGSALTVTEVAAVAHGVAVLANGNIMFTPENAFDGTATFEYTISDGSLTAHATVSVTIGVNAAPVAADDVVTTPEDTTAVIPAAALLANDLDADNHTLRISEVSNPSNGSVTMNDTQITFVPPAGFHGVAEFDYTVTDGFKTDTGSVVITVSSVNDLPVVITSAGAINYDENTAAVTIDPGVTLADADNATLIGATIEIAAGCASPQDVLALAAPPSGITVTGYAAATCTLTLAGEASLASYQAALQAVTYQNTSEAPSSMRRVVRFTVDDGELGLHTGSADREVTVTPADDAPVAVDDSATLAEDAAATSLAVLDNDTDVDAGPKSISAVTQPAQGVVAITGGGTGLTYTPNAEYCNRSVLVLSAGASFDTFTYTLVPGDTTATVSVTVTCVQDAPLAVADTTTVAEGSSDNVVDVLANDTDVDGGENAVATITQPINGTAAIGVDGQSVTYTPAIGYCSQALNQAPDTFTYTLTPGGSSTTVSVTVSCTCGQNKPTDFVVGSN